MKIARIIGTLIIATALVMTSVSTALAGGPAGGWASGIACQNLDNVNDATVTLTFYPEGSATEAIHYDASIGKGGSRNWLTTSGVSMPNFPASFTGSAVVSSSTQLACNVNTQSTGVGTQSSPYRIGTSSGFNDAQASPTMYIPQVVNGVAGYSTYFAVQNTATSDVTVDVTYYLSNGDELVAAAQSATIKGQSTKVFYSNENSALASFNGGAKVHARDNTTKLAVVVALYKSAASYSTAQFLSYNGVAAGANKVLVPRFSRKLIGYNGGLTIQNVGSAETYISIDFFFSGTKYTVHSPSAIKPGVSWILYAPNIAELAPVDAIPNHTGSAIVTATASDYTTVNAAGSLVAIINEDNNDPTRGTAYGQGSTYNAINDGQQSKTLFFPQFTKRAVGVFSSGFDINNAEDTEGTCDITYVGQSSPNIDEVGVVLPANGSISRWAESAGTPSMKNMVLGYNAAVKVVCTKNVTGIVNMAAYGGKWGDSFTQTAGLNQ